MAVAAKNGKKSVSIGDMAPKMALSIAKRPLLQGTEAFA